MFGEHALDHGEVTLAGEHESLRPNDLNRVDMIYVVFKQRDGESELEAVFRGSHGVVCRECHPQRIPLRARSVRTPLRTAPE